MREVRVTSDDASVIVFSERSAGRLSLGGRDIREGEKLKVEIAGRWRVIQIRETEGLGWVGLPCSTRGRPGLVFLHPGLRARRVG